MSILHNNNSNGGRKSTTVTAITSSHDVYTQLYAEETRKEVKLTTVLIQIQKCLQGPMMSTHNCMQKKQGSQIDYCLDTNTKVSTGSNSSGIFTFYCRYVIATDFELIICLYGQLFFVLTHNSLPQL